MEEYLPQWLKDKLAVSAAKSKSVESQLPGREGGPADAYRHLIWAAELTRLYGEDTARAMLDAKERYGRATDQPADQEAMDRHNNEVGIKLGKESKTFDDVVKGAQRTIDGSRDGDNPNGNGATWLPRDQWKKNPTDSQNQELPEGQWNWGDKVDWDGKAIKEPYQYPNGGEEHRHQGFDPKGDVKFPETDGVLDSLGQSSDAGNGNTGQDPTSANPPTEQQQATNQEPQAAPEQEQKQSEAPADPQVAAMVEMAGKPVDNPGRAALLKPVENLTQPEMMDMINHAQGDYRGWRSGDPLKYHTYEKVQDWHAAMYGDGPQQYDGGKPIEPTPIRPIPEQPSPHTTPNGEDLWQATARIGSKVAAVAGSDGYANAVTGLQRGLNMLNASNPLPKRSPAYGPYTGLGPVDEDGQYGPQTDFALKHATARLGPAKVEEGLALGRFNTFARDAQRNGNPDGLEDKTHSIFGPLFRGSGDDTSPKVEGGVLQETLNDFGSRNRDDWEPLKVDNWIGPKTTQAFGTVLQDEDADSLTRSFGRGLGLL
ncbi:hypothetical protein [Magnetospirillum sp. UT-4]|uniref:DUF6973 domain-containing protein n=1 Tax=Magnetospirillum sp. UT-4 TaxID=2681467 RepID=UPI0013806301|nr:hypothetical protein [Magnetospirillum sp. UT-4]CAA7623034.1 hypothetical protein MTBUT4_460006 [Magnetospirillum sp. UT-4]